MRGGTTRAAASGRLSFEQALDALPEMVVLLGADRRVQFVNEAVTALLGWRRGELDGSPVERLLPGFDPASLDADTGSVHLAGRHREGHLLDLELRAWSLLSPGTGWLLRLGPQAGLPQLPAPAEIVLELLSVAALHEDPVEPMLASLGEVLGWDVVLLWRLVEGGEGLQCTARWISGSFPPNIDTPKLGREVSRGDRLAGRPWMGGKRPWTETGGPGESGEGDLFRTRLGIPLLLRGEVVAVLELCDRRERDDDEEMLETAEIIGPALGGWLEHGRRLEERDDLLARLRVAERRQRFLADVSGVLASSLDEQAMLESLARLAVPALADACTVHLVEEDGSIRRVAVAAVDAGPWQRVPPTRHVAYLSEDQGVGRVVRTGVPLLYPHISDALLRALSRNEAHLEALRAMSPVSAMMVPLPGRGRTLGVITLVSLDPERIYGPDDLAMAQDLGRRAGLAVAGAQLYRRERSIASTLQASLLPPALPQIEGVELAGRFRAWGEGVMVGGDFYDAFPVREGLWAMGIGDVCGHGPSAAAMATRVRFAARALAESSAGPAELLSQVNRLLRDESEEESFCTAIYAWLRPRPHGVDLTLVRAGHPLPLVVRAGGSVEEVWSDGTVLGVFDGVRLEETSLTLGFDDALVLYTDGVTEARSGEDFFGVGRLKDALSPLSGTSGADLASAIEQRVLGFAQHRTRDDLAVLVARALRRGH